MSGASLDPRVRDAAGDALWAVMMTWWVAAARPATRLWIRAAVSLAICFAVETSQRYHSPPLDALRNTTLGGLVLGSGFDPRDLLSYTAGVAFAALLEWRVGALRQRTRA